MFSRDQFETACKAFSHVHPHWSWIPGHRPGYGFLRRITTHYATGTSDVEDGLGDGSVEEENDPATGQTSGSTFSAHEYIVYSASFRVPAFYFLVTNSSGSALSLKQMMDTSFFKQKPGAGSVVSEHGVTLPTGSFPMLSQGDHPTLGTACWYLHPCESDGAVDEFMMDEEKAGWGEEERLVRWMELWLMIVGQVFVV